MQTHQSAFTLIELLISLFIFSLLIVITIPQIKTLFQQPESEMTHSQLLRAIHLARSEAIKRGSLVILCKSQNQKTCSGEWQNGYLILSNNHVLFSFTSRFKGTIHWRNFPVLIDHLEFLPSGLPNFENGTFWYCSHSSINPLWAVMISQNGRARTAWPDVEGKIKDSKNKELCC